MPLLREAGSWSSDLSSEAFPFVGLEADECGAFADHERTLNQVSVSGEEGEGFGFFHGWQGFA